LPKVVFGAPHILTAADGKNERPFSQFQFRASNSLGQLLFASEVCTICAVVPATFADQTFLAASWRLYPAKRSKKKQGDKTTQTAVLSP